jgi:replicative DNA helicase
VGCKVLHDYCIYCKDTRLALKDGPISEITGKPTHKKNEFIIDCKGIPGDNKFIPNQDHVTKGWEEDEVKLAQTLYDPIEWAETNLNWKPRVSKSKQEYQSLILRCSSKRKVLRLGRRLGKSEAMVIAILHYLFTNSPKIQRWDEDAQMYVDGFSTILVLTPYLSQVKLIFNRINELLERNPELKAEVKKNVATPHHVLELYNGAKVVGFSSGAKGAEAVRGQKADFIILDEMDYLSSEDIESVVALMMEHSEVRILASSTPSGRREYFYSFCQENMSFKEFYYASTANPAWGPKMEAELRQFYKTETGWQHEILAEFGEAATGVFQHKYVHAAKEEYKYEEMIPQSDWTYSIGIDWNDVENGTKICVIGWDPKHAIFRVVDKQTVQKAGWTQTAAIQELIKLNRLWQPDFVYVDEGYGATQIEVIKQFGLSALRETHEHARIDEKLKLVVGINSSSKVEVFDPISGEPIKKMMKPYMIENAVRRFEQQQIKISEYDDLLMEQLGGYMVGKVTASGVPVYEATCGDHDLDAFVLALLAFQMELSEFTNRTYSTDITFSGRIGEGLEQSQLGGTAAATSRNQNLSPQGPKVRTEYGLSIVQPLPASTDSRKTQRRIMHSPEDFNNDDYQVPRRRDARKQFAKRGGMRIRRTSF